MAEGSREREVKTLEETPKDMTVDMRIFSQTLCSLYVQNAVGTNEEPAKEFRSLRDDTRNDAMVYLRYILPVCTESVSSIEEYFEYYHALNYEEWCEMPPGTLQKITGYKELCSTVLQMHEDILVPLNKRKDEALLLVTKLKDLQVEYEEKKKELEERAQKVSEALIPALENFINGINEAAGALLRIEQKLIKFENKATNADDDPKKLHHFTMRNKAGHRKSACQSFLAVLSGVKTYFLTIPAQGTDQNYLDQWLDKLKKTIREKCSVPDLAEKILKAMK